MKFTQLFSKPTKSEVKGADSVNHRLLIKAGYVDQLMAGAYTYLPLGLKVLRNIENIIREEMNALGSQEILMPTLHPKENWVKTGGWDNIDVLFKISSRTKKDYALAQSAEEIVTPVAMSRVNSYKDLPLSVYQIHWKYRDELRAKSGILRGREFFMKDMYSFHETQEDFDRYYSIAKESYKKIYDKLGLNVKVTEASGGNFSEKISYEFMVITDAGEDDILYCDDCDYCVNVEVAGSLVEGSECKACKKSKLKKAKASEVGNVFDLGQKYGKDFDLGFIDREGKKSYPFMGCYGIGISRVMGAIVEDSHDEKGIIWPASVAPFQVHLISLGEESLSEAKKIYEDLLKKGIEVLWDDRDESFGTKLNDADLLGMPTRILVSKKTLEKDSVEIKKRIEKETKLVSISEISKNL